MNSNTTSFPLRHDWTSRQVFDLLEMPFNDLVFNAQLAHRRHFNANQMQLSTLMNIKTGGCPEDCAYCPQSAHYQTGVSAEKMVPVGEVIKRASLAKEKGASRFCMGAAWRQPKDKDLDKVVDMIRAVKRLGMEACVTLGMLTRSQSDRLKAAGLDYYNHNLDTSPDFYGEIISTRDYQARLDTLDNARNSGINICCGGIIGMGESMKDRAGLLLALANQPKHPESVPVNMLVKVEGTPLYGMDTIDHIDFARVIAAARIMMPASYIRLSAGRNKMLVETQALCFLAGANSIFYGEKLLTTANPQLEKDQALLEKLGIKTVSANCNRDHLRTTGTRN